MRPGREDADRALLASDKLSGRSGRKLTLGFATSAAGSAGVELKKGARVLISRALDVSAMESTSSR